MKLFFKTPYLSILVLLMAFQTPNSIVKKADKVIKNTFEITHFVKTPIVISKTLRSAVLTKVNSDNFFKIQSGNTLIGYGYLAKAPSKTDQFDYFVLFNVNLEIIKTKVLVYREDYGNEIGSKRWLKQFNGKKATDNLRYGDNVDAISGATISAKSMTNAINNVLEGVAFLQENKIL